jgi:hypothetical protein
MVCSLKTPGASITHCDDCGTGPCGSPRQHPAPIMMEIITRDSARLDDPPLRKVINFRDPERQTWLRNHLWHCMQNGKTVTCVPAGE